MLFVPCPKYKEVCMNNIIHLIADYGSGDPAYAEVIQKFLLLDPELRINPVNVPKFSSLATGFWISQLATVNPFPRMAIFSNTAPRISVARDAAQTYKGQYGHLTYAKLSNGVVAVAVHMGYAFSFIKPLISELKLINVSNVGSQFRSRDYYPDGVVGVLRGDKGILGEDVPLGSIPEVPENRIAFIDGYGNIKTSMRKSQIHISEGEKIRIRLNGSVHEAVIGGETYHIEDGQLSYAPGSTGGTDRFMEIWVKGASAWEAFGKPHPETEYEVLTK